MMSGFHSELANPFMENMDKDLFFAWGISCSKSELSNQSNEK